MQTLFIKKIIFPGIALGQDNKGDLFYVKNGDLYLEKYCDVELNGKSGIIKELNYNLTYLIEKYGDKDGLIPISKFTEIHQSKPFDRKFEIENKWCFPSFSSKYLIEISKANHLWDQVRFKISNTRFKVKSRATIFGINFQKSILKAIEEGVSVTHLYCPTNKEWGHLGIFADFLIKITKSKDGTIEFNSWQAIGKESTLFFAHGIMDVGINYFSHLDFAYHNTSVDEIQKLISNGKEKPILEHKQKIFRLDGNVNINVGFELMKSFFPIDNLVDEYYHCA